MVPWHLQPQYQNTVKSTEPANDNPVTKSSKLQQLGYRTYQRYYHVFKKGELKELFAQSDEPVRVTEDYYDHENWCVIAVKEMTVIE